MQDDNGKIATRLTARDGGGTVAYVTVYRPDKRNALSGRLIKELAGAFRELAQDGDLRAVVLTGAGDRAFMAGADVNDLRGLDPASARAFITGLHGACAAIRDLPVPVIARVNGVCLGAGLEIAASCDMRIAADRARFGMPEVRLGIPSVIEAALLPRLIGWGNTNRLLYTGEVIGSADALRIGLIEQVVTGDELDGAVESCVASIAAAGPRAIRAQKALIRRWESLPLDAAISAGIDSLAQAYESDEPRRYIENVTAALRKAKDSN